MAKTVCKDICGNGIITANEECDDNNLNNSDGCFANCKLFISNALPQIEKSSFFHFDKKIFIQFYLNDIFFQNFPPLLII